MLLRYVIPFLNYFATRTGILEQRCPFPTSIFGYISSDLTTYLGCNSPFYSSLPTFQKGATSNGLTREQNNKFFLIRLGWFNFLVLLERVVLGCKTRKNLIWFIYRFTRPVNRPNSRTGHQCRQNRLKRYRS